MLLARFCVCLQTGIRGGLNMKRIVLISILVLFSAKTFGVDYDLAKSNIAAELVQGTACFYQVAECVNNTQPGSDLVAKQQQTAGNT